MSDTTTAPPAAAEGPINDFGAGMGTIDDDGNYVRRSIVADDLDGMSLEDAISGTIVNLDDGDIVNLDDGDIVSGTVVTVDAAWVSEGCAVRANRRSVTGQHP